MALVNNIKEITGSSQFRGFMRSFLIQAGWNAERMQNLGFAYTIIPLLKDKGSDEDNKDTLARHLEFFNTHPYMGGALVAAVANMENNDETEESIRAFKQSMMGPFGALGDSFFWCSLKPLSLLVGVLFALAGKFLLAILVPMVLYNVFHLWMRAWGYQGGIIAGSKMVTRISRFRFALINAALGFTAAAIIAVLGVSEFGFQVSLFGMNQISVISSALTASLVLLSAVAVKRGLKPATLIYMAAGFGLIASLAVF